jgi:hypothetical protein
MMMWCFRKLSASLGTGPLCDEPVHRGDFLAHCFPGGPGVELLCLDRSFGRGRILGGLRWHP